MHYYQIEETLRACSLEDCLQGTAQYVAVLTPEEWQKQRDRFEMGIDMGLSDPVQGAFEAYSTRAEVNYDSLTGTFSLPDMGDITGANRNFAFALDERGIVFIDRTETVEPLTRAVRRTKKWRLPSLERFIYDFLEQIISGDQSLLQRYEKELDALEQSIMARCEEADMKRVHEIGDDMLDLRIHYDQLLDLGRELEENENNFFKSENLRYFRLFVNRAARLYDTASSLRDYAIHLQSFYQSQLDVRQNRIMTLLTVVTSIFMPLTLITGWYGMNFRYMPELDYPWSYPAVIGVCIAVAAACLIYFKRKKWL